MFTPLSIKVVSVCAKIEAVKKRIDIKASFRKLFGNILPSKNIIKISYLRIQNKNIYNINK